MSKGKLQMVRYIRKRKPITMKNVFYITCLFTGLLMGCKKLPEGGTEFNFKKNIRQMESNPIWWDLEGFIVKGIDSTDFVVGNKDSELRKNYLRFFKYSRDIYYQSGATGRPIRYTDSEFTIDLGVSGDSIRTASGSKVFIKRVLTPEGKGMTWKILKCKKDDLILGTGDGKYRLVFKKN